MSEKGEEYNERFETVEQALKYIADSQAKSEFVRKKEQVEGRKELVEWRKRQVESEKRMDRMEKMQANTQRHLDHITKVVRFLADDNEDKNNKIEEVSVILSRK